MDLYKIYKNKNRNSIIIKKLHILMHPLSTMMRKVIRFWNWEGNYKKIFIWIKIYQFYVY